ncbi:MAG: translation initiation factor IF-2 [Robiginitomaculum sp.]|nr:translation initiation factor IF-2 [Robiginitomaculum sp.]MDQ7078712.1 translation initiation factor IF-2 [Robiginitomaculum sp.]
MSDANDNDKPEASGRKPLTLKRNVAAGTVKQSFSRGRSKFVVVEKKRKRVIGKAATGAPDAPEASEAPVDAKSDTAARARALGLSEAEFLAREAAVEKAKAEAASREERARIEAEERARREREEKEQLIAERKKREEEERRAKEEAERAAAEAAAAAAAQAARPRAEPRTPASEMPAKPESTVEKFGGRIKKKRVEQKPVSRSRSEPKRRRGKLTISNILDGDEGQRQRSLASMRRAREREKERRLAGDAGARDKVVREVVIPETITVAELANRMSERARDVVKFLMQQGDMKRPDDELDADTAELIVEEFGHKVRRVAESDVETGFISEDDPEESKKPRYPVVTIMGHVDHGKTSLLDALRSTDVAAGEAGGITQHIGAYQVKLKSGDKITFLDTPGHAAFSSMRLRGAQATDIVVLVVAADDSVMPQTIEAINHAKAADVPIIVAVNKMDKEGADATRVLNDLLQYEVLTESVGGDVQAIEVSALKKTGLDDLVEAITLQAEVLELTANPDRSADGVVIESQVAKGRGPVATVLVKRGTLKRGDIVVAGTAWGKVRALTDERGQQLKEAGPSLPVEVLGLNGAPEPGEPFAVVETEARAREITEYRDRKLRQLDAASGPSAVASLEQMMASLKDKDIAEAVLVVKADVQGSAEAIKQAVEKLGNDEVRARVIHSAAGGITESDILLARSSNSPVIGFNVRATKQARELAEREGVEIRYYAIIYDLLDDIKAVLEGMLDPELRETFLGNAEVLEVFNISKLGKIAGGRVTEGVVRRGSKVRLLRDNVVIHEGELSTLRRFKDEVKEVNAGQECGMGFLNYHDLQKGDLIECFDVTEIERKL